MTQAQEKSAPRPRTLPHRLRVKINELGQAGMTVPQIREHIGEAIADASDDVVRRWINTSPAGLARGGTTKQVPTEVIAKALAAVIVEGLGTGHVADHIGVSRGSVMGWRRQFPLPDDVDSTDRQAVEDAMMEIVTKHRESVSARRAHRTQKQRADAQAALEAIDQAAGPQDDTAAATTDPADQQPAGEEAMTVEQQAQREPAVMFNGRETAGKLNVDDLPDDPEELKRLLAEERFHRAAAEAAVVVLGKGAGPVANRDKTMIAAILIYCGFARQLAWQWVCLSRATFYRYYKHPDPAIAARARQDALAAAVLDECDRQAEDAGSVTYAVGYRGVTSLLQQAGLGIGQDKVRALMRQQGCQAIQYRTRKPYSSYDGETQHRPQHLLLVDPDTGSVAAPGGLSQAYQEQRDTAESPQQVMIHDFHADGPGQRLVTDITEFGCADGKVYLSPMVDLYDGWLLTAAVSQRPSGALATDMLEDSLAQLDPGQVPVVHTDRGFHYRTNDWVAAARDPVTGQARFLPSMSRKGNSGDNAACEGFFGLLKQTMGLSKPVLKTMTKAQVIERLDRYCYWYNWLRPVAKLGHKTLAEHRGLIDENEYTHAA